MSLLNQGDHTVGLPHEDGLIQVPQVDAASELEEFIYIVSHDLRNSARALSEVPAWVREDLANTSTPANADVDENLELMERHAKRLDRMLLDLLVYSRIGRLQQIQKVDLHALLGEVCDENPTSPHVTLRIEGDLPSCTMGYNDAFILFKCVLDNVDRHCGPDPVTLTISGHRTLDQVELTFTDDGPGVPVNNLQRIFRPMRTLRRRDEVEGSGMGLTIIQKIAHYYDGSVFAGAGANGRGFRLRVKLRDATLPDVGLI